MEEILQKSEEITMRISKMQQLIEEMIEQNAQQRKRFVHYQSELDKIKKDLKEVEIAKRRNRLTRFSFLNDIKNNFKTISNELN